MNKLLFFCLLSVMTIVCRSSSLGAQSPSFGYYPEEWMKKAMAAIDRETPNIPAGCPSLIEWIEHLKEIIILNDVKNDKTIIDSLMNTLPAGTVREIAVVDRYIQGFNFSHCTTFMIYNAQGNSLSYLRGCKRDPDPGLVESTPFIIEKVADESKKELKEYLKMRSNCNLDGMFIITILTPDFEIKKIKVVLMPN